jgi:hypothetical protein
VPLADGAYLLVSPKSKDWTPRRGGSQTRSSHPGAAVAWGGRILEVVAAEPQPDGGIRYRLEPWDDRHAIRVTHPYDAASEARREREETAQARSGDWRLLSVIFSPLLGHLPGAVQHRMETQFGAPAQLMTIVSALPVFAVAFVSLLGQVIGVMGGLNVLPFELPVPLAAYLAVESAVRFGSAWLAGHPMGSAAGALIWAAVEVLAGRPLGRPAPVLPPARDVGPLERLDDRFQVLEPYLSLLPEREQRTLEAAYGFDWRKWGRMTVAVLFLLGGDNVLGTLLALAGGLAGPGDWAWLAGSAALVLEQFVRRAAMARGRPRGSVLGVLVRPFAAPILAAASRPVGS